MEIFYINIEKFKQTHDKNFLIRFADRKIENEKGFYQHAIGRYIIKNLFKNADITVDEKGKPIFKNSNTYFSISHSENYVLACFDNFPCAIDIEYIKQRNLKKLSNHFNENFDNLEQFYKFWTYKEACYKLGTEPVFCHNEIFKNEYFLTVVSTKEIKIFPEIKEFDKN